MKHFLSETAVWVTKSEFVDAEGNILKAEGQSEIKISDNEIINESWANLPTHKRVNNYRIVPVNKNEYRFESLNPELGKQIGQFNVDRNIIYSKFTIEETDLFGFEVIIREGDVCTVLGSLYSSKQLINTWKAKMIKK